MQDNDSKDELLHLKSKIKEIGLLSFRLYNKKDHRFENLAKEEYKAFINLKNNKNIIIQKVDFKCNSVVIIDRVSYIVKMEKLLSDRSKFMRVEFNSKYKANHEIRHLLDMEKEIKSCLDDLQNSNYLSKDDYKFMKPYGRKPGVMYGPCKVHKGVTPNGSVPPFCPILSTVGTFSYNLAKFFMPLLKQYTISQYTVKDSFSFCKEIIDQGSQLFMTSFDIQSLFTNFPLDETIDICVDMVYNNCKNVKGMLKCHCKQLLTLLVKSSIFLFNGVCYKEIDAVAMGSPLGPK